MQLDRTRIAIRQRTFVDLLDLAVRVIRAQAGGVFFWLAVGALPWIALDGWLLSDMAASLVEEPTDDNAFYPWFLAGLILWQEPLATAPLTLYLGRTMFLERPRPRRILLDWLRALPQLTLFLVVPRLVLSLCVPLAALVAVLRPHTPEVILLERTRLSSTSGRSQATWARSGRLHAPAAGDLLGRMVVAGMVALILIAVGWPTLGFVHSQLLGAGDYWFWMWLVYLPASGWMAIGFLVVVRFLSYLDLRIRQEGWELELNFRAEAARLAAAIG